MIGYLAFSLAGHDKGSVYYIMKEDLHNVWVCDGSKNSLESPKKKNKKHIQIIKKAIDIDLPLDQNVTNELIQTIVKTYCKDI